MFSVIILNKIQNYVHNQNEQTQQEKKEEEESENEPRKPLSLEVKLMMSTFIFFFGSIHSFYPNFSKFLQKNYGYSNVEAGHLSSIPYVLSSIIIPIYGHLLSCLHESSYTYFLVAGMLLNACAHVIFIGLLYDMDKGGHLNQVWVIFIPILMITSCHIFYSTIQIPLLNYIVPNKKDISYVLSIFKILEGLIISNGIMLTGYLRKATHSYVPVNLLIITFATIGLGISLWLHNLIHS